MHYIVYKRCVHVSLLYKVTIDHKPAQSLDSATLNHFDVDTKPIQMAVRQRKHKWPSVAYLLMPATTGQNPVTALPPLLMSRRHGYAQASLQPTYSNGLGTSEASHSPFLFPAVMDKSAPCYFFVTPRRDGNLLKDTILQVMSDWHIPVHSRGPYWLKPPLETISTYEIIPGLSPLQLPWD